uniref:glutathione transferase n=1 Tax=Sciurus vulgaris TaxID=55149 RepID=A0A8D2AWD0_SCIVU
MGLELFLDLLSQPCRTVYIFTRRNGIPFQLRTVELLKGQHYTESFGQVNPLRKVPALKGGDFTLAERTCKPEPRWMSTCPGSTQPCRVAAAEPCDRR